uniref:EGF-like domain protein n=1 Tax=Angiostrongylus cantonensis TaxID=6313 RepID=A0A158P7L6_ANGCA
MNTANCTLKYHPLDDAVEAVCICPSDTELVKTTIGGDHCERIETNDEMSEFIPCKESGNFYGWFMKMSNEYVNESVITKGFLEKLYITYSLLFYIPFPQYHRKDACDPTAVEKERGVTRENRCTSLLNGICIAPEGIPLCDCHRGYVGENCEVYDPCARNPCGKVSECIAIPDELEVKGELSAQNYRCLCGMADGIDEKNTAETKCVYTGTGNCSRASNPCNHGECLACEHDDQGDILQLCSDKEKRDGFSCKCVPGTFGTLCEHVTDYCQAVGNRMCINGDCYEDPTTTRQFSCYCRFGYHGRNCELKYTLFEINMHWIKENSQYVIPAFSMMCTFMLLFVIYFSCIIKRRLREEKGDDSVHLESIRYRKLKVAMEQKMNVVRKKDYQRRLARLAKKLRTPTKAELKAISARKNAPTATPGEEQ